MRRILVAALAVAAAVTAAPADAKPRTSVRVATTVAGQALPASTLEAAWGETARGSELTTTGHSLPGTVSTVVAEWTGPISVSKAGHLVTVTDSGTWMGTDAIGTQSVVVDYYWGGKWRRAQKTLRVVGRATTLVPAANRNIFYADVHHARTVARRTVPVRIKAVLTFDQPALDVRDLLVVEQSGNTTVIPAS